jgi:hypothetical protein
MPNHVDEFMIWGLGYRLELIDGLRLASSSLTASKDVSAFRKRPFSGSVTRISKQMINNFIHGQSIASFSEKHDDVVGVTGRVVVRREARESTSGQ